VHTPVAAYLRAYEPLAAFGGSRARYWHEYLRSGRAMPAHHGPAAQRELLYRSVGPAWEKLPSIGAEAYVIDGEDGPLICPWQLRPRMAEAVRDMDEMVPAHLLDAFVSPRLSDAALTDEDDADLRGDATAQPRCWHEHIALWHVPTRWFSLLETGERELSLSGDERVLRYRVPMTRARRRARHAYGILRSSLGQHNPVAVSVRQLSEWLSVFHPRSVVEVDYGGLVWVLSSAELHSEDSPQLVHEGLTALARGDVTTAGRSYEQLMRRWRQIRLRERSN
jgi:hypothetical protein